MPERVLHLRSPHPLVEGQGGGGVAQHVGRDGGVPAAALEESGSTGELLRELPRVLWLIGASVGRERCFSIRRRLCSE